MVRWMTGHRTLVVGKEPANIATHSFAARLAHQQGTASTYRWTAVIVLVMNRSALASILLWVVMFMVARAKDQYPATPPGPADLYFVAPVVQEGAAGAQELEWRGKRILVSKTPLLTLRDIETVRFAKPPPENPRLVVRRDGHTGFLTFSEWGARRRAQAERENQNGLAIVLGGEVVGVWAGPGQHIGREEFIHFRGTRDELLDFDEQLQDALGSFHQQPIKVVRELGEQKVAPGWTLAAARTANGARLTLAGPPKKDGKPWSATAELPLDPDAPFVVCWEMDWCVLWAASEKALVGIHFQPDGNADIATGPRENTLRFQDAPANVRREIERVFPPRDGDWATRLGSIAGSVILAGKPAPEVEVQVFTRFDGDEHDGESFKVKTGDDGRFRIEKVRAPASVQIGINVMRWLHPNTGKPSATSGPALCFHSHIVKDQVLEFTLGGEGRPITGRMVDPNDANRDWSKDHIEFVLVPPCSETVAALRANGHIGYLADAYENFIKSGQGRPYAPGGIPLNADGSFRVERLPSAGYWIYVFARDAPDGRRVRALDIDLLPDGRSDEPFDLGSIEMPPADVPPF